MATRFTQLQNKEVICIGDGQRLGFVCDACVEIPTGKITALVVPGPGRLFGLLGSREDYVIPWSRICRMGPDIVLVDAKPEECRSPRGKRGLLF